MFFENGNNFFSLFSRKFIRHEYQNSLTWRTKLTAKAIFSTWNSTWWMFVHFSKFQAERKFFSFSQALNWYINPITAISWLSTYLQLEFDLEMVNQSLLSPSANNVTPSHNDRCTKKRRLSHPAATRSIDSEILKTSTLSNVHRTPMFVQTFNLAARVNFRFAFWNQFELFLLF